MEYKDRVPGEIVEVYRHPEPQEIVEIYSRALPWLPQLERKQLKKRGKKGLWIFLACFAILVGLVIAGWLLGQQNNFQPGAENDHGHGTELPGELTIPTWPIGLGGKLDIVREQGEILPIQEIYRRVNPSVVMVIVRINGQVSGGTGVIFSEDGYVVTNYHVVEDAQECAVILDTGYSIGAKYVAGDKASDLAVLKIDETGFPAAEFGDSDLLTVGDPVYAIGNPLGVELRGTLTDGIVSAINRNVWVDGQTMTLIQTNAALNYGNSGGPLINQYGQVVGINVIKMRSSYSDVEGLGFAIPSAYMERAVNDLLTYGAIQPEPLLGVTIMTKGTQLTDSLWGAEVDSVTKGGAAEQAGVRKGDYVIACGGEEVVDSDDVLRARRRFHVGDAMPMTIWRDGEVLEVVLQLEKSVEDSEENESKVFGDSEVQPLPEEKK